VRGLYAILDPQACLGRDPLGVASAILRGGCAALQLRAKALEDAAFVTLGTELHTLCRRAGVPFVINDRVWLWPELGAEGVHVGQGDRPIEEVRGLVGPGTLIGVSTHSREQAREAVARGADMIGFGPVFATRSKDNPSPVVGLEALAEVCAVASVPVVAIGGISEANVQLVANAGAPLTAAIAAVCGADDPESAARALHRVLTRHV
jgi:thiamine-phosphate pyrophosphorylase